MLAFLRFSITVRCRRWTPGGDHSGVAGGTGGAERRASRHVDAARPPAGPAVVSRLLVMGEIAMAVMLVAAAGLTIRSLQQLLQQDLGFTTRGVLTFYGEHHRCTPKRPARRSHDSLQSLEQRLGALPGVESAGAINMLPIAQTGTNGPVRLPDRVIKPEESPLAETARGHAGLLQHHQRAARRRTASRPSRSADWSAGGGDHRNAWRDSYGRANLPSAVVGRQIGTGFDQPQPVARSRRRHSRRPFATTRCPARRGAHVPLRAVSVAVDGVHGPHRLARRSR